MRGFLELGAPQRVTAGLSLALFVVFVSIPALAAGPGWKAAVAEIERTQDEAIWTFNELVTEYEEFLLTGPSAQEAEEQLAGVQSNIKQEKRDSKSHIRRIMRQYPDSPQVQQAGTLALETITAAKDFALELVLFRYEEYVASLSEPPPPTTTTTTLPPTTTTSTTTTVTSTTLPPVTTTSTLPPTTTTSTTTLPPVTGPPPTLPDVTTTTVLPTTTTGPTTTAPPATDPPVATTTTTTAPRAPATTVVAAGSPASTSTTTSAAGSVSARSRLTSGGDGFSLYTIEEPPLAPTGSFSDTVDGGLAASFSRVLEPVLPTPLADVVASPLVLLELLWRAVTSSGRGLVMPVALLVFSVASLLWDRRRSKAGPVATGS